MIKMLVSARKKPGMSDQAYSDHWGGHHGNIVREHGRAMGFRRYIQSHLVSNDLPAVLAGTEGPDTPKNGHAELWWDSVEAMVETGATSEGQAASLLFEEDERRFCDVQNLSAFLSVEHVLIDRDPAARYDCPSGSAKLFVELRGRDGAPAFIEWLEGHRAFLAGDGKALGALRYIVNRPIDDERFNFAKARGWKPAPDANIEVWFENEATLRAALDRLEATAWLAELGRYADTGRLRPLIATPRLIFDSAPVPVD